MRVILPVAGYGTRLKPHTDTIQKTLLPVAGKAGLDHILDRLSSQGLKDFVLIIGHLGEQVINHVNTRPEKFTFIEQKEKKGLGHAVLQGLRDSSEPVLIHLGDTIFDLDFKAFTNSEFNRIAVGEVPDPRRFGVVELKGSLIIGFHEKVDNPPSNLAIAGLYYFSREGRLKQALESLISRDIRTKGEYQITDAMNLMVEEGEIFNPTIVQNWHDVGVPKTFLATNRNLLKTCHGEFASCEIIEPVYIGKDCELVDSVIGPHVTIMDNCVIKDCEISDSIVMAGTRLNGQKIERGILGQNGSIYVDSAVGLH